MVRLRDAGYDVAYGSEDAPGAEDLLVIAGQMFNNNYDLAIAIIDGMEARSVKGGYALEGFIFNCA
ncbi:transposase [Kalymmatonema gypsitolerans NIES-4073]|nr:transposase [Scytonema sp. NIES-4073]